MLAGLGLGLVVVVIILPEVPKALGKVVYLEGAGEGWWHEARGASAGTEWWLLGWVGRLARGWQSGTTYLASSP